MRTHTPLYRKVGGLHFVRLGRVQFSFCLCRVTSKVAGYRAAQRTIDKGIALIVQREFPNPYSKDRRYPDGSYMLPPLT